MEVEGAVLLFLELLKVKISRRYVRGLIKSHPDYPSLTTLSDVFTRLGVLHTVRRVSALELTNIKYPYLLHIPNANILRVVKDGDDYSETVSKFEIAECVVVAAKDSNIFPIDNLNNQLYKEEQQALLYFRLILFCLLLFVSVLIYRSFSWAMLVLVITNMFGVVASYWIIARQNGIAGGPAVKLCGSEGANNCDRVISSGPTIFGITLPEVVTSYFFSQGFCLLLTLMLPDFQFEILSTIGIVSCVIVPLIIVSIYYQRWVVRIWCKLCLLISALLTSQAVFFISLFSTKIVGFSISFFGVAIQPFVILASLLLIKLTKNLFSRLDKIRRIENGGNRVKHLTSVFNLLLQQQPKIDITAFEPELQAGNANAPIQITVVGNLTCEACGVKHQEVVQLVKTYPDKVSLFFRFSAGINPGYLNESLSEWLEKRISGQDVDAVRLIEKWYHNFKQKPATVDSQKASCNSALFVRATHLAGQHQKWIDNNEIKGTPCIFINGHRLPNQYEIFDLIAMLPALEDHYRTQIKKANFAQSLTFPPIDILSAELKPT